MGIKQCQKDPDKYGDLEWLMERHAEKIKQRISELKKGNEHG